MKQAWSVVGEYFLLGFSILFFWVKDLSDYGYLFAMSASLICLTLAIRCRLRYKRIVEDDLIETLANMPSEG